MRKRFLAAAAMALVLGWMGGCGGSYSGVQAVAPGPVDNLTARAAGQGDYSLYEATGFDQPGQPLTTQKIWTVSLSDGQPLGFRWVSRPAYQYAPEGGAHLEAFAGGQTHDLGVFRSRSVRYVWAGTNADVQGFFRDQATGKMMKTMMMQ